jgi:hypothetical protein
VIRVAESTPEMAEKPKRDREHEIDRMISAAFYRRERARRRGYKFELPPSLRKASA